MRRGGLTLVILVTVIGLTSCASRFGRGRSIADSRTAVGVYRGRIKDAAGKSRRFRLLLYAALPDRIHGEVISAVGSTELIFDGGDERIAITLVRDRVAYTGIAGPEDVEKIVGVPVELHELVAGLLGEEVAAGDHVVERLPEQGSGLPQWLEIRAAGRGLTLRLKRLQPLGAGEGIGTGNPPEGMKLLPLDQLQPLLLGEEERAGEADR